MSRSSKFSSRFRASDLISANIGFAPRKTNPLPVETNVKEGRITSSPGLMFSDKGLISGACVQEVHSKVLCPPRRFSRKAWQHFVWWPSLETRALRMASTIQAVSFPTSPVN